MGTEQGWNKSASLGISFAGTLASIGNAFGPVGAAVGALVGLGAGMFMGGLQYNSDQDEKIARYKLEREANTRNRNRVIRDYKRVYSTYRSDFDTKYGNGLFDSLSMDFQKLIGITNTSALSSVIANMEYDKISGEITSKLTGDNALISKKDRITFSENTFNLQEFGEEYLRVLGENLRKADTEFGIQMQSISEQEKGIIDDYNSAMISARTELAYSFKNAFLNRQAEQVSENASLGQASVAQATSGLRQTDSGSNLTIQQQFQMDLSNVVYLSIGEYYLQQYKMSSENRTRQMVGNMYQLRSSIAQGTKAAEAAINTAIQQANETTISAIDSAVDYENAIYQQNKDIGNTNDSKIALRKDKYVYDEFHHELTGDIF